MSAAVRESAGTSDFTLIIPTFNRPLVLAQLLNYLARQKATFPVLVLDSSGDDAKAANAALIGGGSLRLDVRLLSFDSSITPFEKFWRGSEAVETAFCSFCADDDVVMLDAIPLLVGHLNAHADVSAAHGLYFTFYATDHIGITSIVYAGASFAGATSLVRFTELFRRYEAVTYAVYRTGVMRHALKAVLPIESMLARELLGSALTVIAGKVARLPILYYGRSLHPSWPYENWHPIDFLISSPQALFDDYARYRPVLVEALTKDTRRRHAPANMLKVVDLTHLRYMADYVNPVVMDFVIEEVLAGTPKAEIMKGVWPRLTAGPPVPKRASIGDALRGLLQRLRFEPEPTPVPKEANEGGVPATRSIASTTQAGLPREYRLYEAFSSELNRVDRRKADVLIAGLVREMNAYG